MIIGIDPGAKGGVAILDNMGKLIDAVPMPKGVEFYRYLKFNQRDDCFIYIEKAQPHREKKDRYGKTVSKEGIMSTFTNGFNYGKLISALEIYQISYGLSVSIFEVYPISWKSAFNLTKDKKESMRLCEFIFPESKQYIYGKNGGALDGIAEAILIAHYGHLEMSHKIDRKFYKETNSYRMV